MAAKLDLGGFLLRWLLALFLVLATFNPSGYSFVGWVFGAGAGFGPGMAIAGLLLLIGWIVAVKWTFEAIGWLGVSLGAALFASVVWWIAEAGLISLRSGSTLAWVVLVVLSLLLAIGMAWSLLKRQLSGQINVDELED